MCASSVYRHARAHTAAVLQRVCCVCVLCVCVCVCVCVCSAPHTLPTLGASSERMKSS